MCVLLTAMLLIGPITSPGLSDDLCYIGVVRESSPRAGEYQVKDALRRQRTFIAEIDLLNNRQSVVIERKGVEGLR